MDRRIIDVGDAIDKRIDYASMMAAGRSNCSPSDTVLSKCLHNSFVEFGTGT